MAAVPIVMAVMAAASSGIQMQQQKLNMEAEEELQAQNNQELDRAAVRQYDELSAAEREIQTQASLDSLSVQKQYIQARGRQAAMSGASGTYGSSVDAMLRDLNQTRGQNLGTINHNREVQLKDIQLQAEQIRYGARAQKGNRIFNKPTTGQIGLAMASSATSAYYGAGG